MRDVPDFVPTFGGRILGAIPASALGDALQRRVDVLAAAVDVDILPNADRLLSFARALAGACEVIEVESSAAADPRVGLAAIIAECELIATAENVGEHRAAA